MALLASCSSQPAGSHSPIPSVAPSVAVSSAAPSLAPAPPVANGGSGGLFGEIPQIVERTEPSVVAIFVQLGNGTGAEVGALALAIGSPIGFEDTVTQGIVSGLHRNIPGSASQTFSLVDLIQTDAAISPGNSGGALVGADATIIGINVAYIPPNPPQGRGAVSIGFAIPAPTVTNVVQQLLAKGKVAHPYIGIQMGSLTPRIAQVYGYGDREGVVVLDVTPGSPAAEAGIAPGDLIVKVGDRQTPTVEDLLGTLRGYQPGDSVQLSLVRGGKEREVSITLGELPS
jgi:S1-C subfamily serine protease